MTTIADARNQPPRRIAILINEAALLLNVAGPAEVFNAANHESIARGGPQLYAVEILSPEGGPLLCSSGIEIGTKALPQEGNLRYDTIAVAGGMRNDAMLRDTRLIAWLVRAAEGADRIASFGGGAFVLARAGLLDMRRCVTHWLYRESLQASFPILKVDPDALFVSDGKIYTTAGSTAGIDLAIQMLEEDFGRQLALDVARVLLVARKRTGEQPQISAELRAQSATVPKTASAAEWIVSNLDRSLRVTDLADRFAMSERNFSRLFKRELGVSPQQFIAQARIEAARRWLVDTDMPVDKIARRIGFANGERLTQSFRKAMTVTPGDYRHLNRRTAPDRRA